MSAGNAKGRVVPGITLHLPPNHQQTLENGGVGAG